MKQKIYNTSHQYQLGIYYKNTKIFSNIILMYVSLVLVRRPIKTK